MRTSSLVYRAAMAACLVLSAASAPGVALADPTDDDLETATPLAASIAVTVRGVDAWIAIHLRIDGTTIQPEDAARPHRVDPGEHTIEIEVDGYAPLRQTVNVEESTALNIEALLSPLTAGGGAQQTREVPEAVLSMIGKDVALSLKGHEVLTGRLLSANSEGFSLQRPHLGVVLVARGLARGIRLDEGPPVAPPRPQPPAADEPPPAGDTEGTPRSGVVTGFFIGFEAGVASLDAAAQDRGGLGLGAHIGFRMGTALWDQWAINVGFAGLNFSDTHPIRERIVDCYTVNGADTGCGDPYTAESSTSGAHLSFETGYQRRFRPWQSSSLLPGVLAGYQMNVGGLHRGVGCEGCRSITVRDVETSGFYAAPFFRVTMGEGGYYALSVRSQWFFTGDLTQATMLGFEGILP